MSSNKRRKLEVPPDQPPLSAFARRKALQSITRSPGSPKKENEGYQGKLFTTGPSVGDDVKVEAPPTRVDRNTTSSTQHDLNPDGSQTERDEAGQSSSLESRVVSPEIQVDRPPLALSSFRPNKSNFGELGNGTLRIKLAPGERLVVLGQYELSVKKGQVTMMGSIIQASKISYPVFALLSHSVPVIRCLATDINEAEISLRQYQPGLETLGALSPLYSNLGNKNLASLGIQSQENLEKPTKSTFQILFSPEDASQQTYVQPIISAPEWNAVLAKCSTNVIDTRPPILMICGPKSSGKSTFAKLLTNKLLFPVEAPFDDIKKSKQTGVALLDIDPGQPEYSPPGQLALLHIQDPNYGPPFTHPIPGTESRILRSHAIGALSPAMDTNHYMACVLDLVSHYQHLQLTAPGCPLVINTPGWVLGTGLEILVELITRTRPSGIIYMSQEGPPEVVNSLKEAAKSTPVTTLPSQVSEYTTRTAAHLRTMQYLSYFHVKPESHNGLSWNGLPLTSIPPWEIIYSGENAGILGVMCYGEQPTPDLLADTINGSLLAVVVIDDMAAIPGWAQTEQEGVGAEKSAETTPQQDLLAEDTNMAILEEDSFEPRQIQTPLILPTPKEGISYFNPANSITLNPRHSHSIGLALVRGIDVARRRLQVLTPIAPSVIQEINDAGKSVVLVSGKLDTPGWAYTEELTLKTNREREESTNDNMILDGAEEDEDEINIKGTDTPPVSESLRNPGHGFENAPWVEKLEGSQGRGVGSRVWRVRRDLGKQGDGE
ncbi:related to GRC3 Protein required for cell growth and possibly involved in rRNA processing [Phialocephala subalpina]|uniref:Polynucleotide 5'-hydroxyl-kinase GRC3 n=1 Tax=Phialocephala subalpina TaxID=576137 RepID=A0A1L7WXL8_9HELO|nr:related to GRC3 Protein required for cell growth and possibly involved in rRNA processing [Phialocephala subalpina]